jgi:hypothetical protein
MSIFPSFDFFTIGILDFETTLWSRFTGCTYLARIGLKENSEMVKHALPSY